MTVSRANDDAAWLTFSWYRREHCSATIHGEEIADLSWPELFTSGAFQSALRLARHAVNGTGQFSCPS